MKLPEDLGEQTADRLLDPQVSRLWHYVALSAAALLVVDMLLGWYWSSEPEVNALPPASEVRGDATASALISVASTLLEKPGGYLSNDILPHRLWLDNMPNWEFGALVQVRDMARVLRRDFSRSQSQSQEDVDLSRAEPQFNFDNASWAMPATESEYQRGIDALVRYRDRLRAGDGSAHFYARADNLNYWLGELQNRLGSLSLQLSQSVGREDVGINDEVAAQVKTPWSQLDDRFYEARGACWAMLQLLRAAEQDFGPVLDDKQARIGYRQVLRELEATQATIWSPVILNGSGFGMLANHSLVMANYISRANAAIIDLRQLLAQG